MKTTNRKREALEKIILILSEIHNYTDLVIVEGSRDVESLKSLGCLAEIEVLNHLKINDYDLAEQIASKFRSVVILTDFDEAGLKMNQKFSNLFALNGLIVEEGIRRRIGRLMMILRVNTVESVDNIKNES
jgi:5S rRNA maturation endonuclease (ribonuclease M5)